VHRPEAQECRGHSEHWKHSEAGRTAANTLSATEVVRHCGPGDLERIRRRLKCERCKKKAARLIVLPPV